MLLGVAGDYHRMMGPDLDSVVPEQVAASRYGYSDARQCAANYIYDSPRGACPATDTDRCIPSSFHNAEWLDSVWTANGTVINAVIHNEFHGDALGPPWCDPSKAGGCWYSSVTYAQSQNGGALYGRSQTQQPPMHLVAEAPYQYRANGGRVGLGVPTNIVNEGSGGWVTILPAIGNPVQDAPTDSPDYPYFHDQPTGPCAIATFDIQDPSHWQAWSGTNFNNTLTNPYLSYPYTYSREANHVCYPLTGLSDLNGDNYFNDLVPRSLVHDTTTGNWILLGMGPNGFSYSYSRSLAGWWSALHPIMLPSSVQNNSEACRQGLFAQYPSIIDPTPPSDPANMSTAQRNFETIDDSHFVDLFFVRRNATTSGTCSLNDRDLIRVKLKFTGPH